MAEYSEQAKRVLRKNALKECGLLVGQINIVIKGLEGFQTVSFYCNQPKSHLDMCAFRTKDLIVQRTLL